MFTRSINRHFQTGFTLLEIMLVLVVIGMASVGVMMAMPQHGSTNESIDWQAQRFTTLLQLAEDEALISGKELALVFQDNSYRFVVYDYARKKWTALDSEQIGKLIEMPKSIDFEYTLLGSVWDEIDVQDEDIFIDDSYLVKIESEETVNSYSPQVYIMSSGEVTPFKASFSEAGNESDTRSYALEVSMSGVITRNKSGEK